MRRLRRMLCVALALAVLPALPATAAAAVGDPYELVSSGGSTVLTARPALGGSTLVVQVTQTAAELAFAPAAVDPGPCSNATAGRTVCPAALISAELAFTGVVVEARARDVVGPLVSFRPSGSANDSFTVDGTSSVTKVVVDPGAGADSVTVAGAVSQLMLAAADPGDDRYDIQSTGLAVGTLLLGDGNDVASSASRNLTLDGGNGDDTLSGEGPLDGQAGNDLLEPSVMDQHADGGAGGDDRLSFDLIDSSLVLEKSGTDVHAGGVTKTGVDRLEGGRGNDTISGDGGADILAGGDGDDTIEGHGGGDTLDGGPGDNTVSYATDPGPVDVDLAAGHATAGGGPADSLSAFRRVVTGPGNDTVLGTAADEVFTLGDGNDSINAGPGNDTIDAGAGDDLLRGGHGTDGIDGGAGHDTATYDERTASEPVSVTLATPGDDGAAGENDTLAGIEDVVGGASSDVLAGDDGPNVLVGGGGLNTLVGGGGADTLVGGDLRDVLSGGPGSDVLLGGGDDDSIDAYDGEPDVVDCGPSLDDDAQVDASDQVSGCEFARRGDVPVPVDADGDGTVAGFDCDDANPAIGLAAVDIPGDGIDQNCDGFDEPLALVASGLQLKYAPPTRSGTRFTKLVLTRLQGDSTVVATCRTAVKRRCPFTRATRKPARAGGQVSLTALLKRRVLPVGTTLELRVTAPGVIGRVRRFTVRSATAPRQTDLCLLPGSSVAKKCPADAL